MDSLEYLQIRLDQLSENKIFIGLIMIMVNIGARFIIEELGEENKKIIQNTYFRKVVVFCSVFMATRDLGVALIVTIIFSILMHEVLKSDVKEETKSLEPNNTFSAKQELDNQIEKLKLIKDSL